MPPPSPPAVDPPRLADELADRTHGQQNSKAALHAHVGADFVDGIEKYLGSGMIRSIGPVYAKKMVKAFGEKVFDIAQGCRAIVFAKSRGSVEYVKTHRRQAEQKIVHEIMVFLQPPGWHCPCTVRIYKTYGADAVQVATNPYPSARARYPWHRLQETANLVAMKLGIEKTAMIRVRARNRLCTARRWTKAIAAYPPRNWYPLAGELLEVERGLVQTAMDLELADGEIVSDTEAGRGSVLLSAVFIEQRKSSPSGCCAWPMERCPGLTSIRRRPCLDRARPA